MIRIMLQKLIHKKWMIISLLIGNILLIATAVSHPMYRNASLQRMLTDEFEDYIDENNEDPAKLTLTGQVRKGESKADYQYMKNLSQELCVRLGVSERFIVKHNHILATSAMSMMNRNDSTSEKKMLISSMSDLESHAQVVSGRMYEDTITEDGFIEAVVTMNGFITMKVLVGEEFDFLYLKDANGNKIKVRIVGVVTSLEATDDYWVENPDYFEDELLISENIFEDLFIGTDAEYNYNTKWHVLFDYESVSYRDVKKLREETARITAQNLTYGKYGIPAYQKVLESFLAKEKRVEITLTILQVPVLVLLCAFLYMISRQLLEIEQNEISLLKSRGASKGQIFRLYLGQSAFLAGIGMLFGLPLGSLICKVLGSASAFLEFVQRRPLKVQFTVETLIYAVIAAIIAILMTVLPAMKQSGISIVKQKQSKARMKKPFWQKFYLDIVLLLVSLYGYYNFRQQEGALQAATVTGKSLDPLLFLSSSLFILGAALVCLRIQRGLVRLFYQVGKRKWKPAEYTSFLQILRSGSKQFFIMTFLMLTVALGIFYTTVARTILSNAEKNLSYNTGADLVFQEIWKSNEVQVKIDPTLPLIYTEPDYGKYGQIPGLKSMTRVYRNEEANYRDGKYKSPVTVMGIHTKTFGETAAMPVGLLDKHFYTYLNELATDTQAILVSSNFRDVLGYSVGDYLTVYNDDGEGVSGTICDFISYFPTYDSVTVGLNPDGTQYVQDSYLVIANLSTIQEAWGVEPYDVWMNLEDTEAFYRFIENNEIGLRKCVDMKDEIIRLKQDTLFEGTNGILTMSFIVILVLCSAGFLIYWILSIRSRELLFGIFRAMGMSKGEILRMLVGEQIFSSVLSIGCGTGIGILAARMFVPMIQTAYASSEQVLPMELITRGSDMVRLFGIIGGVLLVCLVILTRQVFKLKIAQALKLGED